MKTKTPSIQNDFIRIPIVKLRMVRSTTTKYSTVITHPQAILKMLEPIYKNNYRETVTVVGLDSANKPTLIHVVGEGSPNQSHVFMGNVFKPLLLSNSVSFILVHNHPASTYYPSGSDEVVTKKVAEAGKLIEISLTDHIVLNANCTDYFSMRAHCTF